jgi:hypothetical protein
MVTCFNAALIHPADLIDIDDLASPSEDSKAKSKPRRPSAVRAKSNLGKLSVSIDPKVMDGPPSAASPADVITPTEGMSARQINVLKRKAKANKATANKYIPH